MYAFLIFFALLFPNGGPSSKFYIYIYILKYKKATIKQKTNK